MTTVQIEEYRYGYENEEDRKDWGVPDRSAYYDSDPEEE
jgi:hypothetical protein